LPVIFVTGDYFALVITVKNFREVLIKINANYKSAILAGIFGKNFKKA